MQTLPKIQNNFEQKHAYNMCSLHFTFLVFVNAAFALFISVVVNKS